MQTSQHGFVLSRSLRSIYNICRIKVCTVEVEMGPVNIHLPPTVTVQTRQIAVWPQSACEERNAHCGMLYYSHETHFLQAVLHMPDFLAKQ